MFAMDRLNVPPPPQDRKRKDKPKTIFENDALLIEKCREYLQLHQVWRNARAEGDTRKHMWPRDVAEKLKITEEDATEMMEFAHSPEYGEFERDHILSIPHISVDLNGNQIQQTFDPSRSWEL